MTGQQGLSILCVDDDPMIRVLLERVLARGGHSAVLAEDGLEALRKLNRDLNAFQLVITDLRMPRLDGFGFIERARVAGYSGEFIVLAGQISSDDRSRLSDLHVGTVIQKPARPAELLEAVRMARVH